MLNIIDILFFVLLFIIISSPFMYKLTKCLILNTTDSKGYPNYIGIFIHSLIFGIVTYFYFKSKESFENICPPGYTQSKPNKNYFIPNKPWCELATKKMEASDDDEENDDNDEEEETQNPNLCDADYTSTKEDSYYTDTKSWCRKKDETKL